MKTLVKGSASRAAASTLALCLAATCAPIEPAQLFVEVVSALDPDAQCLAVAAPAKILSAGVVDLNSPRACIGAAGTLDDSLCDGTVGACTDAGVCRVNTDAASRPYIVALSVALIGGAGAASASTPSTSYPNYGSAGVTTLALENIDVFFTVDGGELSSVPASASAPRQSSETSSVLRLPEDAAGIIVTAMTADEATKLRANPALAEAFATRGEATVFSNIRLRGRSSNGTNYSSSWVRFPITLCEGCIVAPAAARCGPTQTVKLGEKGSDFCLLGQDFSPWKCEEAAEGEGEGEGE